MSDLRFSWTARDDGVVIKLSRRRRRLFKHAEEVLLTGHWPALESYAAVGGIAHLKLLIQQDDGRARLLPDGSGYLLAHAATSELSEVQAHGLGLPPAVPFDLRISTRGHVGSDEYGVVTKWLGQTGRPLNATRTGAILDVEGSPHRVPSRLLSILEAVDELNEVAAQGYAARVDALARLRAILPEQSERGLEMESALEDMRLSHATAFSVHCELSAGDAIVTPVLFGRHISDRVASDGTVVDEAEALLAPIVDEAFQKEFAKAPQANSTYVVERGTYVFIDPALKPALAILRKVQQGTPAERLAFVRSPQAALKQTLLAQQEGLPEEVRAEQEAAIDRLFVETRQLSERVIGFGLWAPPALPQMERVKNEWRPESFAFYVDGKIVQIAPTDLDATVDAVRSALDQGVTNISIGDATVTPNRKFLDVLVAQQMARPDRQTSDAGDQADKPHKAGPYTLLTRENFLALDYVARLLPRAASISPTIYGLKTSTRLLPHQQECLEWLRRTYLAGWPGVLLADDMGLGKTLQSLAFLRALKEAGAVSRGCPILIVAPVGLLANWQKEHALHLAPPGLGTNVVRAWGTHLRTFRLRSGSDSVVGQATLDTNVLAEADWILTTYETLRDYQASFGPIRFSVAVFDEIQKAKNPGSRLTGAVRAVNADFKLGMTGTPVENGLADLWTILDCLAPGLLGDLRGFLHAYPPDDSEAQQRLAAILLGPTADKPSPVMRRLKSDILTGLPKKTVLPVHAPMPEVQARRYAECAHDLHSGRINMLSALHTFRSISLHPWHPEQAYREDLENYVNASARLGTLFGVLDSIRDRQEKALVFLESIELQTVLAELLQRRYRLPRTPLIINGQVSGAARQAAVDEFQDGQTGFDVMILSPRAGGVGLTLTAANHVIHLSRWWNPAVEDQCSDRVYRIGQRREVSIHLPLAQHPAFDERSYDLVLHKLLEEKRLIARGLFVPTEIQGDELARRMGEGAETTPIFDPLDLDRMEPLAFEAWVARQARVLELEVQPTPRTGDGGADLVFRSRGSGKIALVQCKHRADPNIPMDERPLDDLDRAVRAYGMANPIKVAVTNATRFTASALTRASQDRVKLLTRDHLLQGLREVAAGLS